MKEVILILCLIIGFADAQQRVKSMPDDKGWVTLHNSLYGSDNPIGSGGDGIDTSNVVTITDIEGAASLFFLTDTTGMGGSDSCLSVWYDERVSDTGWCKAYNHTGTHTLLDTVNRSISNTGTAQGFYMNLGNDTDFAPGEQIRFYFGIGVGDSLKALIYFKRQ